MRASNNRRNPGIGSAPAQGVCLALLYALSLLPVPSFAIGDTPGPLSPLTSKGVGANTWLAQGKATQPQADAEVGELISQAKGLKAKGDYQGAARLWEKILAITEQSQGTQHPHTAISLNNLASLYEKLGRYGDAEFLYKRSLAINEKVQGPEHPDTAASLNNLMLLYARQSRYGEAELLLKRSLVISEKVHGPGHPETAVSLNNLA